MTDTAGSLARTNAAVALGTAASRLTGLIRIIIFAVIVGQTSLADAFEIGNNAPNVVYELVLGGALAATLVPLFTKLRARNDAAGIGAVCGTSAVVLVAVTAAAVVVAPWIVRAFTVDVAAGVDPVDFRTTATAMTRVFVLQIAFYGVTTIGSALLNATGRFLAAAWAPVAANVVAIAGFLALGATAAVRPVPIELAEPQHAEFWWLVGSTTLGIATMAVIVLVATVRAGAFPRPSLHVRNPAVGDVVRLSAWSVAYIATNQVALVIVKNLASPGTGNLDAYVKAYTLFQLPHGLLAVSLAVTFVPLLAKAADAGDVAEYSRRLLSGLRMTAFLTLPAGLGMVAVARPIVGALLEHGAFDDAAADAVARALTGFGVGLAAFSTYLFALRGFYAHGDTRTPFFVNVIQNGANVAFAVLLAPRYGVTGLAWAFSASYGVGAIVAVAVLARRHLTWTARSYFVGLVPMITAALAMMVLTRMSGLLILGDDSVTTISVARSVVGITVGILTYAAASRLLRVPELSTATGLLLRGSRDRRDGRPRG
jgi:putative peptidoglycan lipid II flippase